MGYSPLQAAGALVPMALVVIPLSRKAPAIAARVGVRVAGATGLSLMALGFIVLSTLEVGSSYAHFLAGLLPFGAGMALAGAPATTAIVASLPRSKQGVASAVNDVSRELGGALGIAVLGSLMNGVYRAEMADSTASLPAGAGEKARGSLAAAQQIGEQLGPQGHQLVLHAQAAFLHGFTRGLIGGAALLLLGALFVAVRAPGRAESRSNANGKPIGPASGGERLSDRTANPRRERLRWGLSRVLGRDTPRAIVRPRGRSLIPSFSLRSSRETVCLFRLQSPAGVMRRSAAIVPPRHRQAKRDV